MQQYETKQKENLTETEEQIVKMLTENTGTHFLDSGGAYGRSWQRNQGRDFKSEPEVKVEVWTDQVLITKNVFHYLSKNLEITKDSKKLMRMFDAFVDGHVSNKLKKDEEWTKSYAKLKGYITESEHGDKCWMQLMKEFAEAISTEHYTTDTYNYENCIGQVLQYTTFKHDDREFIMLQIHGGCDVRGGYTKPYIFEVPEMDYFIIDQSDLSASCNGCHKSWRSDDSGYHWYPDYSDEVTNQLTLHSALGDKKEFIVIRAGDLMNETVLDQENNEVRCKCGGKIGFY